MNHQPSPNPHIDTVTGNAADEPSCHVVIFALPDGPQELCDLFVEKLGMHPTDARIQAHAVPGMLPGRFTRRQAGELVDGVRALGVSAEIIDGVGIADLDAAETIHHARCSEPGLEIVGLRNQIETVVGWKDVRLLSVGYVPLGTDKRSVAAPTGIVTSGRRTWASSIEVSSLSGPEAWLVCGQAQNAYRINHNLMNYEYLENRKTGSATHNFRLFIEDVFANARNVYATPASRAFLGHGLLRHFAFEDSAELQRYTQFHLLISNRARKTAKPHFRN